MRLVQLYDVNSFADLDGILLHVRWVEKVRMNAWVYIMDGEQCEHQKCVFNVECVTMSSTIIICAYRILSKIVDTLIVWTPQL